MNQAHTKHFIGANNIKLIGDVGGDAASPCVVLLHGGGQTRHSWRDAMQNLINRGFHVINMDARGHGDSQWAPDGDYSLDTLARDLSVSRYRSPR
jgi:alpha-beta hydrolase superfamily lysophospholipase